MKIMKHRFARDARLGVCIKESLMPFHYSIQLTVSITMNNQTNATKEYKVNGLIILATSLGEAMFIATRKKAVKSK